MIDDFIDGRSKPATLENQMEPDERSEECEKLWKEKDALEAKRQHTRITLD